ncbi:hypothetical protein JW905_12600 [bacterium]|nr:hypothetical protein [candidate division CSSED10-310 bacterium]
MIIQYFVPHAYSQAFFNYMLDFLIIAGVPAIVIGVTSLWRVHWIKVRRRVPGYFYSAVTLFFIIITAAVGFIWQYDDPRGPFRFLFESVQISIQSTMFSLLAFYIASAAYRAFRARNAQATVLLIAAVIVMIGRTSFWGYIPVVGKYFPIVTNWLMYVPNLAAKRGIYLGLALGSIATSLKMILGIERSYLGGTG